MKYWSFLLLGLVLCISHSDAIVPALNRRYKHGPLYEGIQSLIADEEYNVTVISYNTMQQFNETTAKLKQDLERLQTSTQDIGSSIKKLQQQWQQQEKLRKCLSFNEQDIAHFNRELIYKFNTCSLIMEQALERVHIETSAEVAFIKSAATQMARVSDECNVKALRRSLRDQSGIILCVAAEVGAIKQHLLESSMWCLDVVADIFIGDIVTDDDGAAADEEDERSNSCRNLHELQQEFKDIQSEVQRCLTEKKN